MFVCSFLRKGPWLVYIVPALECDLQLQADLARVLEAISSIGKTVISFKNSIETAP